MSMTIADCRQQSVTNSDKQTQQEPKKSDFSASIPNRPPCLQFRVLNSYE